MIAALRRAAAMTVFRMVMADAVQILVAAAGPSSLRQLAPRPGARRDAVAAGLQTFARNGLVTITLDAHGRNRYELTADGRKKMASLLELAGR